MKRRILFSVLFLALAALACRAAPEGGSPAGVEGAAGDELFERLGCGECHGDNPFVSAPSLEGIYGEEVTLEGGQQVVVDEAYLRQSILAPEAQIVQGYQNIMPSYAGRLSEAQLEALIEYLSSLE